MAMITQSKLDLNHKYMKANSKKKKKPWKMLDSSEEKKKHYLVLIESYPADFYLMNYLKWVFLLDKLAFKEIISQKKKSMEKW